MLLSLSYYKFACHYFLHLWGTLCTHTSYIFCILLLCSAAQKMKNSLMKTSSRHASPSFLPVMWCFVPLCRPLGLVISFYIKTRCNKHWFYLFISLFVALCVKIDPDTHKGMHSVFALKLGVIVCLSLSFMFNVVEH
jgi:hypothetical protein